MSASHSLFSRFSLMTGGKYVPHYHSFFIPNAKFSSMIQLLPPANEVWGKVMFSQVFVCPQWGRGVCIQWGQPGGGRVCLHGGILIGGVCIQWGQPGGGSAYMGGSSSGGGGGVCLGGSAYGGSGIWNGGRGVCIQGGLGRPPSRN